MIHLLLFFLHETLQSAPMSTPNISHFSIQTLCFFTFAPLLMTPSWPECLSHFDAYEKHSYSSVPTLNTSSIRPWFITSNIISQPLKSKITLAEHILSVSHCDFYFFKYQLNSEVQQLFLAITYQFYHHLSKYMVKFILPYPN